MAQRRGARPLPQSQNVTKDNINQVIVADKMRLQINRTKNRQLLISDGNLTDQMILQYMQTRLIQEDIQDIRNRRLQRHSIRELKGQLQEVLSQCLRTGRINNVLQFLIIGNQVQTVSVFMRELGFHRNGYRANLLENIPFFKYGPRDLQEAEMCSICFSEYEEGAECVKLECNHIFHRSCITQWLRLKKNCPLCKRQVKLNLSANPN